MVCSLIAHALLICAQGARSEDVEEYTKTATITAVLWNSAVCDAKVGYVINSIVCDSKIQISLLTFVPVSSSESCLVYWCFGQLHVVSTAPII